MQHKRNTSELRIYYMLTIKYASLLRINYEKYMKFKKKTMPDISMKGQRIRQNRWHITAI